jgi:hypothetical protein
LWQRSSIFSVAYEFTEYESEPEPQGSFARGSGPPRKHTGIGILDPAFPPKRPPGPIPAASASLLWRIVGALLLAGLAIANFLLLLVKR